jgi:hypothetical protein
MPFDAIDDGSIDLLSIDVEGSEWYVLNTMRSRPTVISLETHGKTYRNPFLPQIRWWMSRNGYRLWYMERSDSVYVRPTLIYPTLLDGARLAWWKVFLFLRRSYWLARRQFRLANAARR